MKEILMNNEDMLDWLLIICIYEFYRLIKYKNVENKKKFYITEIRNFLITIAAIVALTVVEEICGVGILAIIVVGMVVFCVLKIKKMSEDERIDLYQKLLLAAGIMTVVVLTELI